MSLSTRAKSPAESGLKTTAPAPAGCSPHSTFSVTAAVVNAKSRSPAGPFSFLRPKRMSPRPTLRARLDLLRGVGGTDFGLQLRQLVVDLGARRDLRELAVDVIAPVAERVERPGCGQLLDRAGPGLQLLRLVAGPLDRLAGVLHPLADAGRGLADLHLGLRGRVLRLDHFLLGAERLDPGLELLLRSDELFLLRLELLDLRVEPLQLLLRRGLPLQRFLREVVPAGRDRLACLGLELDDVLLDRLRLQLEPFLRRDDVGDAALDVLELREHLLVRVVERLRRVLGAVERARSLRPEDQHEALHETGHPSSSSGAVVSLPPCSSNEACIPSGCRTRSPSRT